MHNHKRISSKFSLLLVGIFVLAACQPAPAEVSEDPIGLVSRVSDIIEQNAVQVDGTTDLFQDDSFRLFDGGEGELVFGAELVLRLFNDTQTGGVRATSAPGTPLFTQLALFAGGISGQFSSPGGQASFDMPNGASINVFGTSFLVVYDEGTGWATACNFDGSMEVSSVGEPAQIIQPGAFRQVSPDGEITDEAGLTFSLEEWEANARGMGSPTGALGEMGITIPEQSFSDDTSPPGVEIISVEPQSLAIGLECPGAPDTIQITVEVFDDSPIRNVVVYWQPGNFSYETLMERIDDQTYTATIGPVEFTGDMLVTIVAEDAFGNVGPVKFVIPVQTCIG